MSGQKSRFGQGNPTPESRWTNYTLSLPLRRKDVLYVILHDFGCWFEEQRQVWLHFVKDDSLYGGLATPTTSVRDNRDRAPSVSEKEETWFWSIVQDGGFWHPPNIQKLARDHTGALEIKPDGSLSSGLMIFARRSLVSRLLRVCSSFDLLGWATPTANRLMLPLISNHPRDVLFLMEVDQLN